MANAQVSISFEALDEDDARSKIEGWTLHEGCNVFVAVTSAAPPATTDANGNVVPVETPELETAPPPEPEPKAKAGAKKK